MLGEADGDYVLRVRCSKGTYIRTLCHDIGAALGCGGVMSALRRTEVGGYRVEDAHTMDELCALPREAAQRLLLSVDSLWPDAPQVTVDAQAERFARCGNPFRLCAPDGVYRIYAASGSFCWRRSRTVQPSRSKVFRGFVTYGKPETCHCSGLF